MKILYVSAQKIPPKKWGAVEKIIWERQQWLEQHGHEVHVHVSRGGGIRSGILAKPWEYDLVHVECDWKIKRWVTLRRLFGFPLLCSTHYGYGPFPDKWIMKDFGKALEGLRVASPLLLQSTALESALRANGVCGTAYILPNAIHCHSLRYTDTSAEGAGAICLGRVEPRKRQNDLAQAMAKADVPLDFVGPLHPTLMPEFAPERLGSHLHYRGEWTGAEVNDRLTDYRAFVLISDGETQVPLATMEAMAAGLSIVTTAQAAHNLDSDLPFVQVINPDKDDIAAAVTRAVRDNARHRSAIREYALTHFDWSVIGPRYVDIVQTVAKDSHGWTRAWRRHKGLDQG